MMRLRNLAATSAIAGGLALTAIGMGAGIANAAPVPWSQDHGHGKGHGHDWDDWRDHGGWRGPGWPVPVGCVSATGPAGLVVVSGCV
jgi:hypothetical protein